MKRAVVAVCLLVLLAPAALLAQPEFGLGAYQGAKISLGAAYPSFLLWATPDINLAFGLMFSTVDTNNFGFYSKFAYRPFSKGNVRIVFGGGLEVVEFNNATFVNFGALGGADVRLANNFSVIADIYPFVISVDGDAEAVFFDGRLGAAWWFK